MQSNKIAILVFILLWNAQFSSSKAGKDVHVEDDDDDDDDDNYSRDAIVQWVKIVQTSLTAPLKAPRNKKVDSKRFIQGLGRQLDEWAKDAMIEEVEQHELRKAFWDELNARIASLINSQQRQGIFSEELSEELRSAVELLKTDLYDQVQSLRKLLAENDYSTFVTRSGTVAPAFEKIVNNWKDLLMAGIKYGLKTDDHQFYTLGGMLIGQWVTSVIKELPSHRHLANQWRQSFWQNFDSQMKRYFDMRPDEQKNGVLVTGTLKSLDALIAGNKKSSDMLDIFQGFWIDIDEKYSHQQQQQQQQKKPDQNKSNNNNNNNKKEKQQEKSSPKTASRKKNDDEL